MFLSLKTLYRKRTVIWPFYFYTIIRTLSIFIMISGKINLLRIPLDILLRATYTPKFHLVVIVL